MSKTRDREVVEQREFVISVRPGIDWLSLGAALLIGVVFRYVHIRIPW